VNTDAIINICPNCEKEVTFTEEQLQEYDGHHLILECPECGAVCCFVCEYVFERSSEVAETEEQKRVRREADEEAHRAMFGICGCFIILCFLAWAWLLISGSLYFILKSFNLV
jgi:hypothetical protein